LPGPCWGMGEGSCGTAREGQGLWCVVGMKAGAGIEGRWGRGGRLGIRLDD
jgi:hypothetical protein